MLLHNDTHGFGNAALNTNYEHPAESAAKRPLFYLNVQQFFCLTASCMEVVWGIKTV